jgi:hypothetical protein
MGETQRHRDREGGRGRERERERGERKNAEDPINQLFPQERRACDGGMVALLRVVVSLLVTAGTAVAGEG